MVKEEEAQDKELVVQVFAIVQLVEQVSHIQEESLARLKNALNVESQWWEQVKT